jgi:protein TonB
VVVAVADGAWEDWIMSWLKGLLAIVVATGIALGASSATARAGTPDEKPKRVRVAGNVMQQKLRYRVEPVYPEEARRNRIEGTVRLTLVIATDGSIQQIRVDEGHPLLAKTAVDAVRQWKYEQTFLNGEPVEVLTAVNVEFHLK